MSDSKPRRISSSLTNSQGVEFCKVILDDITDCKKLHSHPFGESVYQSVTDMQARLEEGGFFTLKMEEALNNWYTAVQKWTSRDQTQ